MNRIIIDGDQARLYGVPKAIPTGQVGFSTIRFEFSSEWDGMPKIAQFMQGENKYNVAVENNECTCPNGLVKGWVSVRVRGYSETDVIATANDILLPVSTGFQSGGIPPIPAAPDLYQQFLKVIQDQIGDLADLTTEEKENLVAAINEAAASDYATKDKAGTIKVGDNLKISEDGVLSVDTTDTAQQDNTKPMTSAGVYTLAGNIEVLLATL